MAWLIARTYECNYDWAYQVVGVGSMIVIGFAVHLLSVWLIGSSGDGVFLLLPILFAGLLYVPAVVALIWAMPWLLAMDRTEIRAFCRLRIA